MKKTKAINPYRINSRSDFIVALFLILLQIVLFLNFSHRNQSDTVYLISLIWYISFLFFILKYKVFSGVGLFSIYLLLYVQSGFLMQKYYSYYVTFSSTSETIVTIYNFLAPIMLLILSRKSTRKKTELKQINIQRSWLIAVFAAGVFSMLIYYLWVGSIPLLSSDAENFRVSAIQGKGFLIVIASNCFQLSVALSKKNKDILYMSAIGALLLFGTGYRSGGLTLLLLMYLIHYVGKGKKYLLSGAMVIIAILVIYALLGVMRSGIEWGMESLYMPILWRFFVNTSNFDMIIRKFPISNLQYGLSFLKDLIVILPGSQQTFMMQLRDIMGVYFDGGSITPSVFGEGFYNWGLFGSVVWPIVVICIISYFDGLNKKKYPSGMYFIYAFMFTSFSTSSFVSTLVNSFVPITLLFIVVNYLNKRYRFKVLG